MPKKIIYESAVFQLATALKRYTDSVAVDELLRARVLTDWIADLSTENPGHSSILVRWDWPQSGQYLICLNGARFYSRRATGTVSEPAGRSAVDEIAIANASFFDEAARNIVAASRLFESHADAQPFKLAQAPHGAGSGLRRKKNEETFHDEWAADVDVSHINVRAMNTACTAPEIRFIRHALGTLTDRRLLDVGCGLGEASVYFAIEGADVTATDISPGMLGVATELARRNSVRIRTVLSASEDLIFVSEKPFDVIYTGNMLHHVDITETLSRLLPLLKDDGVFVSWDPVAYNPIINLYRRLASHVRTANEHPLTLADIRLIQGHFRHSQVRWFWLTTLVVFIVMFAVQRRNPNRERFWKKVIEEADQWAWLYRPLERLDTCLLTLFPFLRPLCWNVVIIGRGLKRAL